HSARFHPLHNLRRILACHVMRIGIFGRSIRRHDDVHICLLKIRKLWGCVQRLRLCSVAAEDVAQQRISAVALIVPLVMKVSLLPKRVRTFLAVKPRIQQYCFAFTRFPLGASSISVLASRNAPTPLGSFVTTFSCV